MDIDDPSESDPIHVWKVEDVFGLINARSKLNYLFTGKRGSSKDGWEMVATNLRSGVSPYQCKKKWENLQTKYKKIIQPSTGKGLEERTHGAHVWPFFNKMNEFMSSRHTINPLLLIQSSTPTQAASSSSAPQTSVGPSTTVRISSEDLLPPDAATFTRPSSTSIPSSFSFPSLHSLQLSPSYCPDRSSSCSPHPISSPSPGPSSGSPRQTLSYSPYPSPSYLSQRSSSAPPKPSSCSTPIPHLSPILQEVDAQPGNNHPAGAKKRRRPASGNSDAVMDLITVVREDLNKQDRDREEGRKIERDLLEVLREFLLRHENGTQNP